jgi:hypothetical protein
VVGDTANIILFLKLSCYHDNSSYSENIMFCQKGEARVSACMYFLVVYLILIPFSTDVNVRTAL